MTTYKVAFNDCHGGFRLSDKAMRLYCERKGIAIDRDPDGHVYCTKPSGERLSYLDMLIGDHFPRHDPVLIQVIEDLGEEASGLCADIQIAEISEPRYWIREYDGWEEVETPSSIEWVVIEDDSAGRGGDT